MLRLPNCPGSARIGSRRGASRVVTGSGVGFRYRLPLELASMASSFFGILFLTLFLFLLVGLTGWVVFGTGDEK